MKAVLTTAGDRAEVHFPYDPSLVTAIKAIGGFRWSPDNRCWWSKDHDKAKKFVESVNNGSIAEMLRIQNEEREELVRISKATDSDMFIPCPDGHEYMPFQKAGIAYASSRKNVLFGDEPGLGKTMQAIGLMNLRKSKRILVICPATLKLMWKGALTEWLTMPLSIGIAEGKNWPNTSVVVINYDILHNHVYRLNENEWDLMVIDEAHYLKNPDARRTRVVFGYTPPKSKQSKQALLTPIPAKSIAGLTGTPIPSRPIEGWTLFHALDPVAFPSFMGYAKRYCNATQGYHGWDFSGSSNLLELQEKLRASFMVRRLKKDVLTELPPKRRQIIELEARASDKAAIKAEWDAYNARQDNEAELIDAIIKENDEAYKTAVNNMAEASKVAFTAMSKVRHDTAVSKVDRVIDFLENALESGPVVCMAHHREVVDSITDHFKERAVKLYGGMSKEDKNQSVEDFQSGKADLFVGSISAAGVGLTLTRSSTVVFAELDWVPGNVTQAEDRCHRIGQKDSVNVIHLVIEGSLDSKIAKTLVEKQEVIDKALDKELVFDQIVLPATVQTVSKKEVEQVASLLTDDEIALVHACIRTLDAMNPDGASTVNEVGFNKVDSGIGHSLATCAKLTSKQASLGLRICRKYNNTQLGGRLTPIIERLAK